MKNCHLEDRDVEKITRIGFEDSIWMKLTQIVSNVGSSHSATTKLVNRLKWPHTARNKCVYRANRVSCIRNCLMKAAHSLYVTYVSSS